MGDRCCLFGKISKKGSTVLELAFSQSAFPASSKQIKNNYYFTVCPFAQKEYAYDNDYDIFKEVTSRRNTDNLPLHTIIDPILRIRLLQSAKE